MEFEKKSINELKECILNKNIVLNNGEIRKFDLLDFYLFSNLEPIMFIRKMRKELKPEEYEKILNFFEK